MKAILEQLVKGKWEVVDKNASVEFAKNKTQVTTSKEVAPKGNYRLILNAQLHVSRNIKGTRRPSAKVKSRKTKKL